MGFWVAKNRQKPEENPFAQRRRRRGQPAPEPVPEPVIEAEPEPVPVEAPAGVLTPEKLLDMAVGNDAGPGHDWEPEPEPEPETPRRGRKPDPAVAARTALVLRTVREAGAAGISKSDLAAKIGESEAQVYTSLRQLANDGKVVSEQYDGRKYRWIAV
jgi:hypothetical protein